MRPWHPSTKHHEVRDAAGVADCMTVYVSSARSNPVASHETCVGHATVNDHKLPLYPHERFAVVWWPCRLARFASHNPQSRPFRKSHSHVAQTDVQGAACD